MADAPGRRVEKMEPKSRLTLTHVRSELREEVKNEGNDDDIHVRIEQERKEKREQI